MCRHVMDEVEDVVQDQDVDRLLPCSIDNVLQYLHGRECNAVYDGYTYMPFYMGTRYGTYFSHNHDFEPSTKNHMIPGYGAFGRMGIGIGMRHASWTADGYSGMKKTHGPPHKMGWWPAIYDPLENN